MIKQTEWQSVLDKLNESLSELGNLEIDTDHKFENCGKLHVVTVVGMFLLIDSTERSESWRTLLHSLDNLHPPTKIIA